MPAPATRHSGSVKGNRVGEQPRRVLRLLALEASVVVMLRLKPQVTADLDRGPRKGLDDFGPRAFKFHDVGSGLNQEGRAFHRWAHSRSPKDALRCHRPAH